MKTPPLLLGAALLFWGWQTGFLVAGALMAAVLEAARLVRTRWEFSDTDFSRIWTFCTVLFLATAIYAFTDNGGPARFSSLIQNPNSANSLSAGAISSRTADAMLRWLPMVLFLFVVAQAYSSRDQIPLTIISLLLRRRWKQAANSGGPPPVVRGVNVSYPYFAVCLYSASIHSGENNTYFWGLMVLLAWALWTQRSRRVHLAVWAAVFAAAVLLGYAGQSGLGRLQGYIQNLDSRLLAAFMRRGTNPSETETAIGQIGRIKTSGKIVIRLEPRQGSAPPPYLREAAYRVFKVRIWSDRVGRNDFSFIIPETNNTTWNLPPPRTNSARVNIACYLEDQARDSGNPLGLLPLPTDCGRLEHLPAIALKRYGVGTVVVEGPGLVMFDALYGSGRVMDSPPTNEDLIVWSDEQPALDQVISELQVDGQSPEQKRRAVMHFFQSRFSYSTWLDAPDKSSTNETPLGRFLLKDRKGHCEYFATAAVLLLRELKIPARYAVGYAVHERAGDKYVVRLRDAHAWCLVWNAEKQTWEDFDTTPASWVAEEAKEASSLQWLSDIKTWLGFQFSKFRWSQTRFRQYLLIGLIPVLAFLLYQIIFRRLGRRNRGQKKEPAPTFNWPGLDSEFYRVEIKLARRGLTRRPNELLSEWLQRATKESELTAMKQPLDKLLRLHYRCRFDPHGLNPEDRESLRRGANEVLEVLEK
jgi:transglutaminase-like putative cysteine protease